MTDETIPPPPEHVRKVLEALDGLTADEATHAISFALNVVCWVACDRYDEDDDLWSENKCSPGMNHAEKYVRANGYEHLVAGIEIKPND